MANVVRYKENPFLSVREIPVKDKRVMLGKTGEILLNQVTGEVKGTHMVAYRKVDADKFVKLFAQNIGLTFDLTGFGIRAFNVLLWVVQYKVSGDVVTLDKYVLEEFCEEQGRKFDIRNFRRGLTELESAKIIAKTFRKGDYFINPHFCFNGDRLAFTTVIERKKKPQELKVGLTKRNELYIPHLLSTETE